MKTICVALWVVNNRVLSPRFIMNSQSRSTSSACTQSALKNKLYLIVCYVRVCVCVLRIRNSRIYGCICTHNRLLDNCHFDSLAIFYVDWLRRQVQLQVEQGRRRTKARQLIYGIAINYCRTLSAWAAEGGRRGERHERLPGEGIIIEPHGVCVTRHESRLTNVRIQAKIAVEGASGGSGVKEKLLWWYVLPASFDSWQE